MIPHHVDAGDGLTLHVEERGDGAPLLLLHGFTGSARTWDALAASLHGCRTLAVDLPGHGASSAPTAAARYALPRFADDLARLLDALHLDRATVLGYSLGGRAALHFAVRHPARVRALVLESASPGIDDAGERRARREADARLADDIERGGVAPFVDQWEALPLWESQRALPAEARAALRAQRLSNDASGLANSLRGAGAGAEPSLAPRLGTLTMPVTLIVGALDTKYVAIGQGMSRALPHATLAVVPEAGHAVHLERPASFARLVEGFVASVSPESM